jgi:DNA ligase (NAD+)
VGPAQRIDELRASIRRADDQYYNRGFSDVTDAEYDQWFSDLRKLEREHPELLTKDSPTQRVGAPLPKGGDFATVAHLAPMGSIESLMAAGEVQDFGDRVRKLLELPEGGEVDWYCEPKLDGASANLLYEDGRLVRGLSRGDGAQGEDLTQNLRTIRNLPMQLAGPGPFPSRIEIRGEVIMSKAAFRRLQEHEETSGEGTFRNARNTTAGTLKLQDPRIVARRPLDFLAFAVGFVEGIAFKTHGELRERLAAWGFTLAEPARRVAGIAGVMAFRDELEARRDDLPYELDGIVAKVDRLDLQTRLGRTSRTPRWALAYKFAPRLATTRIERIGAQVGRTGAVTPVAHLDPVELAGVTVRNASLHNWALVAERDVRQGDTVEIQRAGDVIPEVVRVFLERRPADSQPAKPPERCPACDSALHHEGKFVYCQAIDCKDQLRGRVVHLAGRRAFDIEGLGPKQVEQLAAAGLLKTVEDVFALAERREAMLQLERFGARSVQNLLDNIEKSKRPPLARFLHGIGIRHVGEQTAKDLAAHFGSLDRLAAADAEGLMAVDGVGEEVATAVVDFFASAANRLTLAALQAAGVQPQESSPAGEGPLAGRIFVFTGGLTTMSRDEAKERVERLGARTSGSISKKVSDVVAGEAAGGKLDKARSLGLNILDETAFVALLQSL